MIKKIKKRGGQGVYKFIHIFTLSVLVINMSMVGMFFVAPDVSAAEGESCVNNEDCSSGESCNGDGNTCCIDIDEDDVCDQIDTCIDKDEDGYGHVYPDISSTCLGTDCNDSNSGSWVGDCCFVDQDNDFYINPYGYTTEGEFCWCGDGTSHQICSDLTEQEVKGNDCDDSDENINPDILEVCDDGIDNDCDGDIDCNDDDCSSECEQTCEEGDVVGIEGYIDYVDIGSTTSEAGHDLGDWSDEWVKPGWGGNYGGGSDDESFRLLMGHGDDCGTGYEEATLTFDIGDNYADQITFEHLDGSVDDSFDIYINDLRIGHYTGGQNSVETWVESTYKFAPVAGVVTVKFFATEADNEWCANWGQVAFSWVGLEGYECESGSVCDNFINGYKYNPLALMDMPNWGIELYLASTSELIATTTTESNGHYSFDELCDGTYIIREVMQEGWMQTEPITSTGNDYHEVTLISETQEQISTSYRTTLPGNYDFYNKPMICGIKYNYDTDTPIPGWGITLYGIDETYDGEELIASSIGFIASTTTDSNGEYCFEVQVEQADKYQVAEENREDQYWFAHSASSYTFEPDYTGPMFVDFYNYFNPPSCTPTAEVCDGVDNDCDGYIDEDLNCGGDICDEAECGDGICQPECQECCEGCPEDCGICPGPGPSSKCGNGIKESGEDCDDGNNENGDGCNEYCENEGGGGYFTYTNQGSGAITPTPVPVVAGEEGEPILEITKTVELEYANPGDTDIEYKVIVINNGNLVASNVIITDILPEGLSFVDEEGSEKQMEIGDLEAGESKEMVFLVNVDEDAVANVYTNIAEAKADNHAPITASEDLEVREIAVLAETGFDMMELLALLAVLAVLVGAPLYIRKTKLNV